MLLQDGLNALDWTLLVVAGAGALICLALALLRAVRPSGRGATVFKATDHALGMGVCVAFLAVSLGYTWWCGVAAGVLICGVIGIIRFRAAQPQTARGRTNGIQA